MRELDRKIVGSLVGAIAIAIAPATSLAQLGPELPRSEGSEPTGEDCPEPMRGSTVSASAIDRGIALDFETETRAQVGGLRLHLRYLAAILQQHSTAHAVGDTAAAAMPPLEILVNDIAAGARMTMRATHAEDVAALRALGEELEEVWVTSPCAPEMSMPSSGRDTPDSVQARK